MKAENNYTKTARCILTIVSLFFVVGCASGAVSTRMSPLDISSVNKHPFSVSVAVASGEETNPLWMSKISNPEFQIAIADAINRSGVFRSVIKDGISDYRLDVAITKLDQPLFGINISVTLSTLWILTKSDTNKVLFKEEISSSFTATMGDSVLGVKRLRLANEGVARENIKAGIEKISRIAVYQGTSNDANRPDAKKGPPHKQERAAKQEMQTKTETLPKTATATTSPMQPNKSTEADAEAQFALGVMYAKGQGNPQDYKKASECWRKAADQGHAAAQNNLGVLYAEGKGVPKDLREAFEWWSKAADQGNVTAKENLKEWDLIAGIVDRNRKKGLK